MNRISNFINRYFRVNNDILRGSLGEMWGTFILIVFGLGVILQVELTGGAFLSISLGWGFAVMMAVFWSGKMGNGHCNPAVTLGFATIGHLEWIRVPFYCMAQLLGAFLGALVLFLVYYEKLVNFANAKDNGEFLIQTTGSFFVTSRSINVTTAFFDQFFGTFLLSSSALAITDVNGFDLPDFLHPIMLGLMVAALVGCFAINAGAALNPARDLGPRIMLAMCGWGRQAFTNLDCYFWVPIVAPLLGGVVGAVFYHIFIGINLKSKSKKEIVNANSMETNKLTYNMDDDMINSVKVPQ